MSMPTFISSPYFPPASVEGRRTVMADSSGVARFWVLPVIQIDTAPDGDLAHRLTGFREDGFVTRQSADPP